MRRCVVFACLLAVVLGASACASREKGDFPPALERRWPVAERILRHKVTVTFPGQATPFAFDGLLRLGDGPVARVVCLGPLGMTLCDITVTPEGHTASYLHPAFAAIPRAAENLALCVRSVWFAALPAASVTLGNPSVREGYAKTLLEHSTDMDGRRVVASPFWQVRYIPGEPHPVRIEYSNTKAGYAVSIRFVAEQPVGEGTP